MAAWRTSTYADTTTATTKSIPGYTGFLRSGKDLFGISAGRALAQDTAGLDTISLTKPSNTTAGSLLLSPLDNAGAIWDHRYETTAKAMNAAVEEGFRATVPAASPAPSSIVGYTGHIHMSGDVLGASHEALTRLSENVRQEEQRNVKPATEEGRPHWSVFRIANQTGPEWKQDFAQLLTTRPNPRKDHTFSTDDASPTSQKEKLLRAQIKAAEGVLGTTTPTSAPSTLRGFSTSLPKTADGEDESLSSGRAIVGYTGHLHGSLNTVGVNFSTMERRSDPFSPALEPPHPLGRRYQNAAQSLPVAGPELRKLLQQPIRPLKTGVPIVDLIKLKIIQRKGRAGFRALNSLFRRLAEDGKDRLSRHDFLRVLQDFGLGLNPVDVEQLLVHFDVGLSGYVSGTEFVQAMQGEVPAHRMELIFQAYRLLDRHCKGHVTLEEVERLYDGSHHPEVLAGQKTSRDVLQEFMKGWADKRMDSVVSESEFLEYYRDLSAAIDYDPYFELVLRNAWHISGGQGVSANTSCRRVVVVRADGSETVEEIINDLGIAPHDREAMRLNLEAQGVRDVQRIRLM
eukprot:EG_transcript_6693